MFSIIMLGVDRVVAVDLHCGQIQGFFGPRVPVDNLDGGVIGVSYFGDTDLHNPGACVTYTTFCCFYFVGGRGRCTHVCMHACRKQSINLEPFFSSGWRGGGGRYCV